MFFIDYFFRFLRGISRYHLKSGCKTSEDAGVWLEIRRSVSPSKFSTLCMLYVCINLSYSFAWLPLMSRKVCILVHLAHYLCLVWNIKTWVFLISPLPWMLCCQELWVKPLRKPSRELTRPLWRHRGLKGLMHTLNASVIPTAVS